MVITYPSGHEGSYSSFITITPRVLFWRTGSVLPFLLPQLVLTAAVSIFAVYLEESGHLTDFDVDGIARGYNVLGVLTSFLLVFKTQSAYNQFWTATGHVDGLLQASRKIAMSAVTMFKETDTLDTAQESRRLVRLVALFYFVCVEYFQRTGHNETNCERTQDTLRSDIKRLTGKTEFEALYPDDEEGLTGSASKHNTANPTVVLFWIEMTVGKVMHAGGVPPPIAGSLLGQINALMGDFWGLNKIDKTQFPLPYSQIVKWMILLFNWSLPFLIVQSCQRYTILVALIPAVGFFGLDEVAEVLESPLGEDPNDIDLRRYGRKLMEDLAWIYTSRQMDLDTVYECEEDFDLTKEKNEFLSRSGTKTVAWSAPNVLKTSFRNSGSSETSRLQSIDHLDSEDPSAKLRNGAFVPEKLASSSSIEVE